MDGVELSGLEPIVEQVAEWRDAGLEVDRDQRLVRNVVLTGTVSRNGHRYTAEALQQAVGLYAHKPVFLDHAPNASRPLERSTRDLVGAIVSARFDEGRIRGDIQVLETEAGRTFLALVEGEQPAFGMSHVVLAQRGTNPQMIERIQDVVSVDAVVFPATTTGLREGDESPASPLQLLQEQLQVAQEAVLRLQEQLAERTADDGLEHLLTRAALPGYAVTTVFREQLRRLPDDAARTEWIHERLRLIQQAEQRPVQSQPRSVIGREDERLRFIAAVRGVPRGVLCGS
jgi:hypothetical protein